MSLTLLDDFKAYGRITSTAGDASYQAILDAAEKMVSDYTGMRFVDSIPADLKIAVFAIALHLSQNREATAAVDLKHVPMGAQYILDKYRMGNSFQP